MTGEALREGVTGQISTVNKGTSQGRSTRRKNGHIRMAYSFTGSAKEAYWASIILPWARSSRLQPQDSTPRMRNAQWRTTTRIYRMFVLTSTARECDDDGRLVDAVKTRSHRPDRSRQHSQNDSRARERRTTEGLVKGCGPVLFAHVSARHGGVDDSTSAIPSR